MKRQHLLLSAIIMLTLLVSSGAIWRWEGGRWGLTERRIVTVGFYENAPKVYTGENGRPAGLFVELLEEIARAEGWRLHYVPCKWASCLAQLEQGQLDLMPDVAFSSERGQIYDFHNVSVASSWSQVYSNPQFKVQALDDLAGKRIAILQGGIQETFFYQLMTGSHHPYQPVPVQSLEEGYAAVADGKADAVVTNSFFAARNGGKYKLQETPIVFLPSNLYFVAGKGRNADLLARIDVHLTNWRRSSDSIYFDALHRAMAMPPEVLMPRWVQWSLAGFGAALISLLAISLLLRWQVGQRTRALIETTNELKAQRTNLEHIVVERTAELQALFDSACVGIVLTRDHVIIRSNARLDEMFGYASGEQIGQSTRIWYADEAAYEQVGQVLYAQMARGGAHSSEEHVCRKDGSRFWVRVSVSAINPAELWQGVVGVLEDITAERAAIEEIRKAKTIAEEATRMKSEFLANMSHEIRTPMNAILGMLYLALKSDLSPSQRNQLSKAQGAAHSLLGIINDILDFSKIEAGKLEIEHIEFGLDSVLEQLTDAIGFQAERKGIEFLIRYDAAIPPLLVGDPLRLGQVLLNLCGNAVKFTEQGEVELAFRCLDMTETEINIQISVRDSGIGMSPEVQQKLFDKFTQADQSTTRRFGGTGLGLAISKNLVELMGGCIWVDDSQLGKGSTICFTVHLQIARQSHRQRELVEQAGPLLKGIRVLVVDDNEVSREIMAEMLRFFRLDVNTVPSGAAALAELGGVSEPYDLVLMDWRMPGMNGDEATQHIHLDPAIVRKPKVVMVTAYGREDVIRLSEQAGVDGFLIKPVSPSTLLDTILSVLGRKRIFGADDKHRANSCDLATSGSLVGMRLLLVEDNDINREFATELLRSEGVEIDEAVNGAEAITKVQQQHYDAVLMDVQMPVMDGLEAARRIRALAAMPGCERFASLPIIAMTALAMVQDAEKSQAAGMNDHVTKPVAPDRLMAVLAKWVQLPNGRTGMRSASRASVASQGGEISPDLLALTSLDSREGIRRIGGKITAYRKQLRRFREHYANAIVELQQLAAEQGTQRAEEYCHILKGVTGNIGAQALYEKLSVIDNQFKQGMQPDAGVLDEVETLLQQVLCDINGLDSTAEQPLPTAVPLTSDALRVLLGQLAHALKYDLGAAEPLITELRAGVTGRPLETEVAALAALVDVFDIDAALEKLKQLEASQPDTMP